MNKFDRPQNFGWVEPVLKDEDYIFGSGQVDLTQPLQVNGQWDDFLPSLETQNVMGFETANCTAFGSTNQIETYLKRKFSKQYNFSDRALGIRAGTYPPGNDPQVVYEKIRKVGVADDVLLPFGGNNVDEYYDKNQITKEVEKSEREFLENYTFKHDWVATGQLISHGVMKTALQYSPLACAIYAFAFDGEYYVRAGKDGDWIIITGYEEGKYWKGFTSYSPVIKKFAWNFGFYWIKRINIEQNVTKENVGIFIQWLKLLQEWLGIIEKQQSPTPMVVVPPVKPQPLTAPIPSPVTAPKYLWGSKTEARHSVRVICDEMGLSLSDKNIITAVIACESGFNIKAVNRNNDARKSTDFGVSEIDTQKFGIAQFNDYWYKDLISPEDALNNPEKAVRLMITQFKKGRLKDWVCYSSGRFSRYL